MIIQKICKKGIVTKVLISVYIMKIQETLGRRKGY